MDTLTHSLVLPWVAAATSKFVFAHDMREAVSLALASGQNLIFSGPGGHGKSEFLTAVFDAISDTEPYVKSFGQGTTAEELYGGLDFNAFNSTENAVLQYNPEHSFLARRIAVFEELFDAPARVLTSLKDTMTARELRNGHQRFPMMTKLIAGATNHSPQAIAEAGPEIAALIERFPIQLEVAWRQYDENSYMELFASVTGEAPAAEPVTWGDVAALQELTDAVTVTPVIQRVLAKLIVELGKDAITISPRTAILAMQLIRASAAINGRDEAAVNDINAVAFLPGAHRFKSHIAGLVTQYGMTVEGLLALERIEAQIPDADQLRLLSVNHGNELLARLKELQESLSTLRLPSDHFERKTQAEAALEAACVGVSEKLADLQFGNNHQRQIEYLDATEKEQRRLGRLLIHSPSRNTWADAKSSLETLRDGLIKANLSDMLDPKRRSILDKIENSIKNARV